MPGTITARLRHLRHGKLKFMSPVWLVMGKMFRFGVKSFAGKAKVSQMIGAYGPFKLSAYFAFSNFEAWGGGHNNGFVATVEACRGKTCFLDVGGHIGLVTLPVASVLAPGAKIFAFEPSQVNAVCLRQHAQWNGFDNVTVIEALVGDETMLMRFFESPEVSGQNAQVVKKNPAAYQEVERQQITLDDFCNERRLVPDVIKIDVEGAEVKVLAGARELLRKHKPTILLSVHPFEIGLMGESIENLTSLIDSLGYKCTEIDGAPVQEFRLSEYLLTPEKVPEIV